MGIIAKGSIKSMSQDYHHQGIFSFSNGLEKSATHHHHHHQLSESHLFHDQQQPEHHSLAHQIRRDKLTVESFHDDDPPPLVPGLVEHHHQQQQHLPSGLHHVYQTPTTMLSELFNFAPPAATAVEFPEQHSSFRAPPLPTNSAAAMHLFLMNPPPPPPPRSPSPPSSTSSTLHMLLPNPPHASLQGFEGGGGEAAAAYGQFSQMGGGIVEGQGLSLSLQSSSLQHLEEAAKAQELRIREGGFLYYNQGPVSGVGSGGGPGSSILQYSSNSYRNSDQNSSLHNFQSAQVGLGSSLGVVNMLRNSKYVKAAQELLEEFCSVGRVQLKKNTKSTSTKHNTNPERNTDGVGRGGGSSSSSKDQPSLSTTDRIEHQRRKVKLLSMLDEVERRYNLYREQMQMVVNSFDLVMGIGAAAPYTTLTQKAMSRHFRCLKDAISVQLKQSCEVLGEKEGGGSSGITKGETPRLKRLDQSIRQQRAAFHQMGMMEQEAWRPQRGLPERSVTLLRAWLFEHFLHPYPSDADKHLLARQTGLSRNQVSNWFINARVRLWKPMVEEMYQLEGKSEEDGSEDTDNNNTNTVLNAQNPMPPTTSSVSSPPQPPPPTTISEPLESDPEVFSVNQGLKQPGSSAAMSRCFPAAQDYAELHDMWRHGSMVTGDYGTIAGEQTSDMNGATLIRFGTNSTTSGDVSLTLGLRHAGNMPEKTSFFGGS